jgi:hypothetical protein
LQTKGKDYGKNNTKSYTSPEAILRSIEGRFDSAQSEARASLESAITAEEANSSGGQRVSWVKNGSIFLKRKEKIMSKVTIRERPPYPLFGTSRGGLITLRRKHGASSGTSSQPKKEMSQAGKEILESFNLHRAEEARQALSGESHQKS